MAKRNTFYITTPIYYSNSAPHVGSAYTTLAADVLARWNKLQGKEVFFLTGLDEHGKKIQESAQQANKSPKKFVDEIAIKFKEAWKKLDVQYDNFIRTTDKYHENEVQEILSQLYKKKVIYKGFYESLYCIGCEQYKTQLDLVDGKCPLHNREPELKKEEAYMLKLSSFQDKLLKLIKTNKFIITPEKRKNEMLSFIESGLQDVSISRKKSDVSWGIPLPFDKEHTTFVWVDAFWNYISGLKNPANKKKFWPADVQLMANDILRVHSTIWPAILLSLGYKLPKKMFIHGYFTFGGQKMSKSLGNVLDPVYLANEYGSDSLRYFLFRNIPFGEDGDFSEQALIERHNHELANKLGNLISRVSALAEKYGLEKTSKISLSSSKTQEIVARHMENLELDKALNEIFAFIDKANEYVQHKKPWETQDKKVLYELVNAIKDIAILISPFMPSTSEKIAQTFNFEISLKDISSPLKPSKIKKSDILFRKIEKDQSTNVVMPKIASKKEPALKPGKSEKIESPKLPSAAEVPSASKISYDDFSKIELKVGKILKAEDHPKADKLLVLTVDFDEPKPRTIVAGLKLHYKKDELINKKAIFATNLQPVNLRGIESNGMVLAAVNDDDEHVVILQPEKDIEQGSKIR